MPIRLIALLTVLVLSACAGRMGADVSQERQRAEQSLAQVGYAHLERNRLADARDAFRRALEQNPGSWRAYWGLALTNEREQDFVRAEEQYRLAMRLGGGTQVRHSYAAMLYNQGRNDEALREIREVTADEFYQDRPQAFEDQGYIQLRLQRPDAALLSFQRAIELNRLMLASQYSIAEIHLEAKRFQDAVRVYVELDQLLNSKAANGHTAMTLWLGAQIAHAADQPSYSRRLGQTLLEQFPNSEQSQFYREWFSQRSS